MTTIVGIIGSGQAAAAGELVVVAVPIRAFADLPAEALAGTTVIDTCGYGVVDAGSLADSWRQAAGTPVWGAPYGPYSDEAGRPADADAIRAALAAATR